MPGIRWSLNSSATGSCRVFSWARVSRAAWPLAARMTRYSDAEVPAQVLHHRLQDVCVVVYRQ